VLNIKFIPCEASKCCTFYFNFPVQFDYFCLDFLFTRISINLLYIGSVLCFNGDWELIASSRNWHGWDFGEECVVIRRIRRFFLVSSFLSFLLSSVSSSVPFITIFLLSLR
jgi:hypothetical protein